MTPKFQSALGGQLSAFLSFKRSMGFAYQRPEGTLKNFDHFLHLLRLRSLRRLDWESVIQDWLQARPNRKPLSIATDLVVIRQFCLFRRRYDPKAFVPSPKWGPVHSDVHFVPYIFTAAEIRRMLRYLRRSPGRKGHRRCLRIMLLVLFCTGLRFGEVARLCLSDLDTGRRLFWVRQSKGRTRLVPFGRDLAEELRRYLKTRPNSCKTPASALFLNIRNQAHTVQSISFGLRGVFRKLGMKADAGRAGPRPYDLRHSYAVHRLSRWHRQGVDVTLRLPWLSTYMGHANIVGTETYLTTTPELMALASRRFEGRFRRRI